MRRAALIGLLIAALAPSTAVAAVAPRTTMAAVLPYVMCVTCKIPLANAQSPQAEQERAYIQQLIGQGYTLPQIKKALVAQYGDAVLALPPARGFDIAVYAVPIALVVALAVVLAVMLPRWRRRDGGGISGGGVAPLSANDAARLDADLARFD